ncbi:hypothetical protein XELAEV_18017168mg [Xenopus laevis]|uniref:Uncharacterized protein n=1 Tax=Xenopus laevis TaxID=8355 RepID=A0A974DAP7_XENLA|nr:hypothetical protein XELAEV_18017168mg [Xenopus laevis]
MECKTCISVNEILIHIRHFEQNSTKDFIPTPVEHSEGDCAQEYLNGLKKLTEKAPSLEIFIPSFTCVAQSLSGGKQDKCITEDTTDFISRFIRFLSKTTAQCKTRCSL